MRKPKINKRQHRKEKQVNGRMMMDATNKLLVTEQLRRTHSSPIPPLHNDAILVKVLIPSLDCSKIFRLNPHNVNYEPLVKSLIIAKVEEEERRNFRLYTANGVVINPGDSLAACNYKDKDTLLFKPEDDMGKKIADAVVGVGRRLSMTLGRDRRSSSSYSSSSSLNSTPLLSPTNNGDIRLSSSTGDIRPICAALPTNYRSSTSSPSSPLSSPPFPPNPTIIITSTPTPAPIATTDYWSAVSSFIGSFLKRRPSVNELPRHVMDLINVPIVPKSHVVVACISYLKEKDAHTLEGIFRQSGLATEVRTVFDSFKSETFDLDAIKNPHTVATALKQYCRQAYIIPESTCIPWVHLIRDARDESEIVLSLASGIASLPVENRFILACLFSFLRLVLEHTETNLMAPHSLSVVWGPNLIHFQLPSVDAFSEANIQASIMYSILTHLDDMKLWD